MDSMPDDGDHWDASLLTPGPNSAEKDGKRAALLAQTLAVVRFRKWRRRVGWTTALATCYLAGIATPLWRSVGSSDDAMNPVDLFVAMREADRAWEFSDPKIREMTLAQSGHRASKPPSPYERNRRTGDRYLQKGDVVAAARAYKAALRVATASQREVSWHVDSWLLSTMKSPNVLEQPHATL